MLRAVNFLKRPPRRSQGFPFWAVLQYRLSMPKEAIGNLDRALAAWGGRYESEVYQARHGWTVPDNPAYDEPEAERAYKKLTDLLKSTIAAT